MNRTGCLCIAAVSLAILAGHAESPSPTRIVVPEEPGANPWTHQQFGNDPDDFQFVIVTDRTGGHRPGVFPDGLRKAELLRPEFVMSVGDLIEGYTEDEAELDQQWDEIESFTASLPVPFFYVPGNHDIANDAMARKWNERFGRPYYHFIYRDVLFLCLSTEDGERANISEEQVAYFQEVLGAHPDVRWTLLFMHQPLWVYGSEAGWDRIESLLTGRRHTVFAGHFHTYTKYVRNDERYFILATTGGWSRLGGPHLGQFDHVVWVTMTDDGPVLANLMLDGIWDEDVFTERDRGIIQKMKRAARIPSILVETDRFERGETILRLTNHADVPVQIRGAFTPHPDLTARPDSFDLVIPPDSVGHVALSVEAGDPLSLDRPRSMYVDYTTRFDPEGLYPYELKARDAVVVARKRQYECVSRTTPVVIDGRLDEWDDWPFVVREPLQVRYVHGKWRGPEDSWFRFAVGHDADYLYVAVEVFDDEIVPPESKPPWEQDAVEIYLDARPDPIRSTNRGVDELKEYLKVAVSPGKTAAEMVLFKPELMPTGFELAAIQTDTGHAAELAIPVSYLDERQQAPWSAVRLDVAIDDQDEPGGHVAQLLWRPHWQTPESYDGSGTFIRQEDR